MKVRSGPFLLAQLVPHLRENPPLTRSVWNSNWNFAAHGANGSIQFTRSGSVTHAAEPNVINIYSMGWRSPPPPFLRGGAVGVRRQSSASGRGLSRCWPCGGAACVLSHQVKFTQAVSIAWLRLMGMAAKKNSSTNPAWGYRGYQWQCRPWCCARFGRNFSRFGREFRFPDAGLGGIWVPEPRFERHCDTARCFH